MSANALQQLTCSLGAPDAIPVERRSWFYRLHRKDAVLITSRLNFATMFGTSFVGSESTMAIGLSREVDIVFHSFECHSVGGTVLPKEKP
jgi:hypothetical protein